MKLVSLYCFIQLPTSFKNNSLLPSHQCKVLRFDVVMALKSSRKLVRSKGRQNWRQALDSAYSDTRKTWKHLNCLLGKSDKSSRTYSTFSAEDYHSFIDRKVTDICDRTAGAGPAVLHIHWIFFIRVLGANGSRRYSVHQAKEPIQKTISQKDGNVAVFFRRCVLLCLTRFLLILKDSLQTLHSYGLSPVGIHS